MLHSCSLLKHMYSKVRNNIHESSASIIRHKAVRARL